MTLHTRTGSILLLLAAAHLSAWTSPAAGQPAPCFNSLPTPGWTPFDVGAVLGGASRPVPGATDAFELCSVSKGHGVESDSFRFLFRLVRAHWVIAARLDRLEPGGCAGLDARVHLGSSHLADHPYMGIQVRRLATGVLALSSSLRTEVGDKANDGGAEPLVVKLPIYLRIERDGDTVSTMYSDDGVAYTRYLEIDVKGTGLAALHYRAGRKQASESDGPSTAAFSQAMTRVREDRRPPRLARVEPGIGPVSGGTEVTTTTAIRTSW